VTFPASRGVRRSSALSIVMHAALLLGVVVLPLLWDNTLPAPQAEVRAFFADPLTLPPPPPPPPAAAAHRAIPRPQSSAHATAFVVPVVTPDTLPASPGDLGLDAAGVPGGVDGGVPGGVVGGVVGGLPDAPPPPPVAPIRAGGDVREPRKLKDVPPIYPEIAVLSRLQGDVVLECLVDPAGHVTGVRVVRSIPVFDDAAVAAVKQWVYAPTLLNGVPVPLLMNVTVSFRLTSR